MNGKAVAFEVDHHEIINTSMNELLRTGMENENQQVGAFDVNKKNDASHQQ